jgi:putative ABC transport system permease protein
MSSFLQDVRFAARMLRKNLGFALVAVLTLALGIGANSAIFSVVNAVLLRPLPYTEPGRLLFISSSDLKTKVNGINVSLTKLSLLREQHQVIESIAAYYGTSLSLVTDREPEAINGARATYDLFSVLGVLPNRGRTFLPEDDVQGAPDVAVISDGFWHSHFAADENILGRSIRLDSRSVSIVGVLPASFRFPLQFPEPDVWLPRVSEPAYLTQAQVHTGASYLSVIARLRRGETLARAQAELDTLNARYQSQFSGFVDSSKYGTSAVSLQDTLVGTLRSGLAVLLCAVGFVLLIACANVANLLLARATGREREMALRKALGASSPRLVRQLLIESLLLALLGGFVGVSLASIAVPAVRAFSPGSVPRLADARLDASVLLYSLLLCFITGVLFGFVPALQAAGRELQGALKEGSRGSSAGGPRGKLRALLVVSEMALALILMTGAGLLIESFARLMRVNPGFSSANLTIFPMNLPPGAYAEPARQVLFYRQLLERARSVPGVDAAGITTYLPLAGPVRFVYFCPEGLACQGIGKDPTTALRQVSSGYFDTVRTPVLKGRVFTERDNASSQPVVVVNQTIADRYWPGQNPIGRHLANSRDMIQREVIGVVADVKFSALNAANVEEMYQPLEQAPFLSSTLIVRSRGDLQPMITAMRAKFAEVDPNLPVAGIESMDSVVSASVAQPRLIMQFVGLFAGFALLLAAIGIYGVMAYSVSARRQELGIRMSLGAAPVDILKLVVGQGMRLALVGVLVGLAASLVLTRLIATLLFAVQARDPLAFAVAVGALLLTAFLACYLPARRATRVDPIMVLRSE